MVIIVVLVRRVVIVIVMIVVISLIIMITVMIIIPCCVRHLLLRRTRRRSDPNLPRVSGKKDQTAPVDAPQVQQAPLLKTSKKYLSPPQRICCNDEVAKADLLSEGKLNMASTRLLRALRMFHWRLRVQTRKQLDPTPACQRFKLGRYRPPLPQQATE